MRHADNPLLQAYDLPPFSDIKAEHFSPALDQIIIESRAKVAEIIRTQAPFPTWDDLVLAMDEIHARLRGSVMCWSAWHPPVPQTPGSRLRSTAPHACSSSSGR